MAGPAFGNPARSSWGAIAATACLGLTLFLIASAIVLALIPVYLSQRNVTVSSTALQSKLITMTAEAQKSTSGRRKRETGDLCDFATGIFDSNGLQSCRSTFRSKVVSDYVSDIVFVSVEVAYGSSSKRKRSVIAKRASCSTQYKIILVMKFYLIFQSSCLYKCQLNRGPSIRSQIKALDLSSLSLDSIGIFRNGLFVGYTGRIRFVGSVLYISSIFPGGGSGDGDGNPPTINPSNSTNSVSTTTKITTTGPLMG